MNVLLWTRMSWVLVAPGSFRAGCLPGARANWQISNRAESDGMMASSPGQALKLLLGLRKLMITEMRV